MGTIDKGEGEAWQHANKSLLTTIQEGVDKAMKRLAKQSLDVFMERKDISTLCPMSEPGAQWEVMTSVVDSGATITVVSPETGRGYAVIEGEAAKKGTEYEIANGDSIPNLGEKKMAVMTREGSLRGFSTQVADVSRNLQSVRQLIASGHAVCFGLGPDSSSHIIVNKVSGEVNHMRDDGVNYLQDLWVVPEGQVNAVAHSLATSTMPIDPTQVFGRPAR